MQDPISNTYVQAFFITPAYILDLPGMTLGYLRVYEAIFQFWNHNKTCFLSEKALCEKSGLGRSQIYAALSYFEKHNELKRVQKKYKRYIVRPQKFIETDCIDIKQVSGQSDTSTNIKHPSGRADVDVRPSGRETSGRADHNIKKLTKEYKNTSTTKELCKIEPEIPEHSPEHSPEPSPEHPVSNSFIFSLKVDKEILELKLEGDTRTNEEFLMEGKHHVDNNSDPDLHPNQRNKGLMIILQKCFDDGVLFKSKRNDEKKLSLVPKSETEQERNARLIEANRQNRIKMGTYYGPSKVEVQVMEFLGIAS